MATEYYYLMSSLPSLPALGEAPPIEPNGFLNLVGSWDETAQVVADSLVAEIDLWSLSSAVPEYQPLSSLAVKLFSPPNTVDWGRYTDQLVAVASAVSCPALRQVALFDSQMRHELVKFRSSSQSDRVKEPAHVENDDRGAVTRIAQKWSAAPSVRAGYETITRDRYAWVTHHVPHEPFSIDELCVYAKTLILLYRSTLERSPREVRSR